MKKQPMFLLVIQVLLTLFMTGCGSVYMADATPTPNVREIPTLTQQVPLPISESRTLTVSTADTLIPTATSTPAPSMSPTSVHVLPDGASVLHTWNFGEEGLLVDSAFVTKYGRHLIVAFTDGALVVHNFETGVTQIFRSPVEFAFLDFVNGISSSQAGILVAEYLLNESGNVILWQISSEGESQVAAKITEPEYFVTALEISPDGETLALGYNNGEIRLFRTGDGVRIYSLQAHNDFVMSLAFSWNGRSLLSDSWSFDSFTYVFRVSDGSKIATLATESYEPGRISFSPNSQLAAVTSYEGTHIYSTSNWSDLGFVIPTFEGKFTCDSQGLIATTKSRVEVYSVTTGEIIQTTDTADITPVYCLYDGRTVMISTDFQNNIVTLLSIEP